MQLNFTQSWDLDESKPLGKPGGFGAVFVGTSAEGTHVAIKVLHNEQDGDREISFAKIFRGLKTNHIIPVLDFGIRPDDRRPCIVMKKAEKSLRDHIAATQKLDEAEVVSILIQMIKGLLEAGDVIHRDLKPENCLFESGRWQLSDFGIARLQDANTSLNTLKDVMTPAYAAPEQWNYVRASQATDIYALACVGMELLTGQRLFAGPTRDDFRRQHLTEHPTLTAGSPRFRALMIGMLAKDAYVRPTLDKAQIALKDINSRLTPASAGATALAAVVSKIRNQEATTEANRLASIERQNERRRIAKVGLGIWQTFVERLSATALDHGLHIDDSKDNDIQIKLGDAKLLVRSNYPATISHINDFLQFGWEPYAASTVAVSFPGYTRSCVALFAAVKKSPPRWFEVSVYRMGGNMGAEPTGVVDERLLIEAINPHILGTYQLAHPVRPIEDEVQIEKFIDRWFGFLALAADGKLRFPSMLPEPQ